MKWSSSSSWQQQEQSNVGVDACLRIKGSFTRLRSS